MILNRAERFESWHKKKLMSFYQLRHEARRVGWKCPGGFEFGDGSVLIFDYPNKTIRAFGRMEFVGEAE